MMMTSSLQLLETAGHHFFESCSGAAPTWAVHQLLLNVWHHIHSWWMPSSKLFQHCQVWSLAAAEHLFSAAGQILCGRRCKLSDKHFEMFVFLRDFVSWTVCE